MTAARPKKPKPRSGLDGRKLYLASRWPTLYSLLFGIVWPKPLLSSLSYGNLDPSFIYGVEQAALSRLSFGNHFLATYGPLSYAVNNFLPQDVWRTMLWQLLAVIAVGYGVHLFSRLYLGSFSRASRLATCLFLLLTFSLAIPEWLYLDTFVLYLFIYLKLGSRQKTVLRYALAVVGAALSLVKFTDGVAAVAGLAFVVAFSDYQELPVKRIFKNLVATGLAYFSVLTVMALALGTTNIFEYILSALRMSNGFGAALSSVKPETAIGPKYAAIGLIVFVCWACIRFKRGALKYSFLLPVLYIVWKYSIVRVDAHILTLLEVLPVVLVLVLLSDVVVKVRDVLFVASALACFCLAIYGAGIAFGGVQATVSNPINNIQTHGYTHFFEVGREDHIWKSQTDANLKVAVMPRAMRSTIGSAGVDIYPWEAAVVKANNLKWDPRPSPFSFETYTPQFDADNANFYLHHGPKFIVWHGFSNDGVSGIDSRTDLWDEPQTLKVILADYRYVTSNGTFILLQRIAHPSEVPNLHDVDQIEQAPTHIGMETASIPVRNELVCMNLQITDNSREKLKTLLVRERPFNMFLRYQDSDTIRQLRFVREIAGDGMLANGLPRNWGQLVSLFRDHQIPNPVLQFAVAAEPTTNVTYYPCLLHQ